MEGGPPSFPRGSTCPVVIRIVAQEVPALSPTGLSPSLARRSRTFRLEQGLVTSRPDRSPARRRPTTPAVQRLRAITHREFGLFPFRSPLLRESRLIFLPPGTEMFQFPGWPSRTYGFSTGRRGMTRAGFPHSETTGSKVARHLPGPIAADGVLLRPLAPRHPPCALSSLNSRLRSSSTEPASFGTLVACLPYAVVKDLDPTDASGSGLTGRRDSLRHKERG